MELPVSYRGIEQRSKGSRVDRLESKTKNIIKGIGLELAQPTRKVGIQRLKCEDVSHESKGVMT